MTSRRGVLVNVVLQLHCHQILVLIMHSCGRTSLACLQHSLNVENFEFSDSFVKHYVAR